MAYKLSHAERDAISEICPELLEPKMPKALILATFDTRNFSFTALGTTEAQCWAALKRGWKVHCRQTGADPTLLTRDAVQFDSMQVGIALRDGSVMR